MKGIALAGSRLLGDGLFFGGIFASIEQSMSITQVVNLWITIVTFRCGFLENWEYT